MRTGSSNVQLQRRRGQVLGNGRATKGRNSRCQQVNLEGLESRTLLATIPAATTTGVPQNLSTSLGNLGGLGASENSPTVVVDPLDPNKLVAVWMDSDPALDTPYLVNSVTEGAYSIDGGQLWTPFLGEPGNPAGAPVEPILGDPNTHDPEVPYLETTNPTISFDDNGNFFLLDSEHNAANSSGALVLQKYNFQASQPFPEKYSPQTGGNALYSVIYQWLPPGDQALDPVVAVDSNLASFTDPTTGDVQTDLDTGNIYITWAGVVVPPAGNPLGTAFNPNPVLLVVSSDGGESFSPPMTVNTSGYGPTGERDQSPQLVITQGRTPDESGQLGDAGVPGGTVSLTWDDFGTNQNEIMTNTVTPGQNHYFNQPQGGLITPEKTTSFPQNPVAGCRPHRSAGECARHTESHCGDSV